MHGLNEDVKIKILAWGLFPLGFISMVSLNGFNLRIWTSLWITFLLMIVMVVFGMVWILRPTAEQKALSGWLLPKNAEVAMNDGPGTFQYEVVGESHYLNNLHQIVENSGLKVDEPGEIYCQALLFCEPENEYDPNAVVVVIETKRVGYIPREDAQELAPELRKLANTRTKNGRGGQVLCVQACIGWSGPERIGVRLDFDEFSNE